MDPAKLVDWIKLNPRYLFAVALATGVLVFSPSPVTSALGVTTFVEQYRAWIGVVFLLASVLFLSHGAIGITAWVGDRLQGRRVMQARIKALRELSPAERGVMRKFIHGGTKTYPLDVAGGLAAGLENRQIIYRAASISLSMTYFSFNIQPWAWEYLHKTPRAA